jgi:hypothetical protein
MSYERTIPPIVTDAICFHNEDRIKMSHPFARQPQASMIGLQPYLVYQKSNNDTSNSKESQPAVTKLHTEKYGYSHTAALGVPRQTCTDPKYKYFVFIFNLILLLLILFVKVCQNVDQMKELKF